MNLTLGVCRLKENAILPTKAHADDLGWDLYAVEDVVLLPGRVTKVHTGIACQFPAWCGGLIRDRSSMATKQEVVVVAGVIDPQYIGEIIVAFYNPNGTTVIKAGQKIAQMIITPVIPVQLEEITEDSIQDTTRGENGFGSSGA